MEVRLADGGQSVLLLQQRPDVALEERELPGVCREAVTGFGLGKVVQGHLEDADDLSVREAQALGGLDVSRRGCDARPLRVH